MLSKTSVQLGTKYLSLLAIGVLVMLLQGHAVGATKDSTDDGVQSATFDKYLVIVGAERDFKSVKREAERVSTSSGVPFSMNGNIWDARRGLILPDNCDDPIYCGEYVLRRYNALHLTNVEDEGYVSVEKSDAYPNLKKGYFIALAAICDSRKEAEKELARYKRFSNSAYVAKTRIYMGCIH